MRRKDDIIKFEEQVEILTERSTTMGIEELLLDRAKKEGKAEGIEEGEGKKSHDVVENLISELGLSDEQIARIAEVPVDFVVKVRSALKNRQKLFIVQLEAIAIAVAFVYYQV